MKPTGFNAYVFRRNVDKAMEAVRRILEADRDPLLAEQVDHTYRDKYAMAEQLTNTSIIAFVNALERLGLTANVLRSIDRSKTTTLRFQATDSAEFLKSEDVEIDTGRTFETTEKIKSSGSIFRGGATTKTTTIHKIVQKVQDRHWKVTVGWEISLYQGTDVDSKTVLLSRQSSDLIVTPRDKIPYISGRTHPPVDMSLNWLIQKIDIDAMAVLFCIDRNDPLTRTPRRNPYIDDAIAWFKEANSWTVQIHSYMSTCVEAAAAMHSPSKQAQETHVKLSSVDTSSLFCPVQPLMEQRNKTHVSDEKKAIVTVEMEHDGTLGLGSNSDVQQAPSMPLLSPSDMNRLLNEQLRTLDQTTAIIQSIFPAKQISRLISSLEATVVMLCTHVLSLREQYVQSIGYIEDMLTNQLVAAIGKTLQPHDLDQFVRYHNTKLLRFPPSPFCLSIRRPHHSPDGILSIEGPDGDGRFVPVEAMSRKVTTDTPLSVPINAATTLQLTGGMYLHGWLQHLFTDSNRSFQINARARQFSSFILIIGNMAGRNILRPKDAIIVQNNDELIIPLLLRDIPSAKEFKDAIQSLSPEQQHFAQAFRGMQLESSVFGMCVVQIKPQLEKLLKLPDQSLTKEMKLTNDLMQLFIEYQVPSDLLSFNGSDTVSSATKVANVTAHVASVSDVIETEKSQQLREQKKLAETEKQRMLEKMKGTADCMMLSAAAAPLPQCEDMASRFGVADEAEEADYDLQGGMEMFLADDEASCFTDIDEGDMIEQSTMEAEPSSAGEEENDGASAATTGNSEHASASSPPSTIADFTMIPKLLDTATEKHDLDNALRSTVIKASDAWRRKRQANLLTRPETSSMDTEAIEAERNKAFDLLDALSRSGTLPIECSELHVVVSMTHCFDNDIMGTVVQDNINPIEKLERSTLLVGSTIHGIPARELVTPSGGSLARLQDRFPLLLE